MSKKPATKAEKAHYQRVVELGCIICKMPPQIHHIRNGMGIGQRNLFDKVLPLCHIHHTNGGYGIAFHAGKIEWQKKFGTEQKLLEKVQLLLKEDPS